MKYFKLADRPQYDDTSVKADISALQTGKVDKADGMSLIEDAEKQRLSTVANYDDTEIKADIAKCATKDVATTTKNGLMSATDKKKLNGLATVATTGSYNDLLDKPDKSDYKVFMQETQPTEDGLWIKGAKKDFMFVPSYVNALNYSFNIVDTGIPMPTTLSKSSATIINGKAYIFGGYDATSKTYSDNIVEFDPTAKTCTKLSVSLPSGRRGTSATVINGKAYIFGGYDGSNYLKDILCFDPTANTCTKLSASLSLGKENTVAITSMEKAYIFSGSSNSFEIYCFNPSTNICEELSVKMPYDSIAQGVRLDGMSICLFGGGNPSLYRFYTRFPSVSTLPGVSPVTGIPLAARMGDCAYIFGGVVSSAPNGFVFELNLKTFEFSKVFYWDKTKDISSVVYYNNTIYIFCKDGKIFKTSKTTNNSDTYFIGIKEDSGVLTKVSTDVMISVNYVKKSTNFNRVEAYSILNGVATKIE